MILIPYIHRIRRLHKMNNRSVSRTSANHALTGQYAGSSVRKPAGRKYARRNARMRRTVHTTNHLAAAALICMLTVFTMFLFSAWTADAADRMERASRKYYTSITVHEGDCLWHIAETHMTEEYASIYEYMDEVVSINHLHSRELRTGMQLCIPYYLSADEAAVAYMCDQITPEYAADQRIANLH